jgi:hypothetical protein
MAYAQIGRGVAEMMTRTRPTTAKAVSTERVIPLRVRKSKPSATATSASPAKNAVPSARFRMMGLILSPLNAANLSPNEAEQAAFAGFA